MTSALALVLALATPTVDDAWCARARAAFEGAPARGEDALARLDAASAALFEPSSPVVARARAVVGEDGDFSHAFEVLAAAASEACAPQSVLDAPGAAARVRDLMAGDPRFGGVRHGDDLFDRLRHKAFLWLSRLFESEGMQKFAGSTRTVFFVALGVVAAVVAARVVRRLRRRAAEPTPARAQLEAARVHAFAALRAEAAAALARGDARGALLAGERALRARVGEREATALRAARTHRELLAELSPTLARAVAPALAVFDRALYARDATLEDAADFLGRVDEAEGHLGAGAAARAE